MDTEDERCPECGEPVETDYAPIVPQMECLDCGWWGEG